MRIRLVMCGPVRGGRMSRLAFGLALSAAILLSASLAGAQNAASLKQHQSVLATKSHSALLGLYALDSRLAQTHGELARIHAHVVALRAERLQVQLQLKLVAGNLRVSQELLGAHLRTLYEEGEPNAIAILLGSGSLDDAVTRLNDIEQSARQSEAAVTDTKAGRAKLTQLAGRLAAQTRRAEQLEASARATAASLERARTARAAYLASLTRERRLTKRQLAALDTHARRVVEKAQVIQSQTTAPAEAPTAPGTITVTATGYSLPGHTSTGTSSPSARA
jgi:peptidoglycan hydrolase CwlO-like protein